MTETTETERKAQTENGGHSGNAKGTGTGTGTGSDNKTPSEENASRESSKKSVGITFAGQDKLPKLPIPDLKATIDKYLASLRPLQGNREHQETIAAAHEFLNTDGPDLQQRLKAYATGRTSYIEQFWYDSYLNFDNPVVLNLNPFFLLEDDPTPARNNQVTRAASLAISSLSFIRAVRLEELKPDTIRGNPLDMYQYSRLFGTARVPTDNGCQIGQDEGAKHIVVLCRGQFYWFDVLDDNHDLIMTEKDLAINLESIVADASQTPIQEAAKGALGVLSTENRKTWSGLRDVLTRDENSNNADCLHTVDSALFILCLDDTEPGNSSDLCQNMLCGSSEVVRGVQIGTCTNRWYDKLQIIVCKNGSAGINFEHTGVDGHTVLRFASDVYTDTILKYAKSINGQAPSLWGSSSPDPSKRDPESFGDVTTIPHKLEWDLTPELAIAVRFAETRLSDLLEQNEFRTLDFMAFGKNFITSMGFSPDAFVQMAFQAAYYGMYGRVECTYEPAMTKAFFHGRTEAVRSVTAESVDFVRTFWGDNPNAAKIEALRKAAARHTDITRECAKGMGQDRHLYALYCVWQRGADGIDGSSTSQDSMTNTAASSADNSSSSVKRSPENKDNSTTTLKHSAPSAANGLETTAMVSPSRRPSRETSDANGSSSSPSSSSNNGAGIRRQNAHAAALMPAIFADAGWDKINSTILSTSNCGNPALRQFGFGPASGDGFGIGYIIKDDSIAICASSKHRQTKRFVEAIEGYLLEIRRILRATHRRTHSHKASRAREIDENKAKSTSAGRVKSRGRAIAGAGTINSSGSRATSSKAAGGPLTRPLLSGDARSFSGRAIGGNGRGEDSETKQNNVSNYDDDDDDDDDDELGGYGFFDAGMLKQALRKTAADQDHDDGSVPAAASATAASRIARRAVGKRLHLSED